MSAGLTVEFLPIPGYPFRAKSTTLKARPAAARRHLKHRATMTTRLPAMLVGLALGLASPAVPAISFCNISGTNDEGVEFTLRMNDATHVSGSDYMPNAITANDRRTGASQAYSARHCAVRLFDPQSRIYLKQMRFQCSSGGTPFRNSTFRYDPWKQSFVCTRGCSRQWPRMLEFEMCNSGP